VFNNGTSNAFNGLIPTGGQILPTSTVGTKALWKKAQKNDTKKHTSDNMNSIIPNFNPFWTTIVWYPIYVASLITSLHHTTITNITNINDTINSNSP